MKKTTIVAMSLLISGCGISEKEKQWIAYSTCAEIKETSLSQRLIRVEKVNEARRRIDSTPYTKGDEKIRQAVMYGLCEKLVLNDPEYDILLTNEINKTKIELENIKEEERRHRDEAERRLEQMRQGSVSETKAKPNEIYAKTCSACHSTGVLNAPRPGNEQDWGPRISKGKETLFKHAINGYNAMPPRGTCMHCTDEQIREAIDYMIDPED